MRKAFLILPFILFGCLLLGSLNCARKTADDHFRAGTRFFAQGSYDEAIKEYKEAIEVDPNHVNSHLNLGAVYAKTGMFEEAKKEYEFVLRLNNMHIKAHYNLGILLAREGKKEEAKEHYDFLKSVSPMFADTLLKFIERN